MSSAQSYWSEKAKSLTPYVPGEQPGDQEQWIKLNTNENPYPPSPKALEAGAKALNERLRLYPDPDSTALRAAIAAHHSVAADQVFLGNGSDEVLAFCFNAFFDPDLPVRIPDITYFFYKVYLNLYGLSGDVIPLEADFSLPVEALMGAPGGLAFANPNAPTGFSVSLDIVARLAESCPRAVIVDEAYVDFGGESAIPLIERHPNIVVPRTFSKSHSLAGARVGYAIAAPDMVASLNRVKNSFNSFPLDRVAQAMAQASIEDVDYVQGCTAKIIATRKRSAAALEERGFAVLPSEANFLFVQHESRKAEELLAALREKRIMLRRFSLPRIENFLRITIGTDDEMDALFAALDEIL